jgi:tRNA (adenine22-N1)-methyltransferase
LRLKLGKRLKQLESIVTSQYDHIWDCCCDHGLLGAALLSRQAAPYIHFVDVVPQLMSELENKLIQFFPENSNSLSKSQWQVHCMDVSALPLQVFSGKQLVIIAGVGGDLMTEFVIDIYRKNSTADVDFLLCPVHHSFTLRQQLIAFNFSLQTEALVIEKQRFYEVLLVSSTNSNLGSTISPVGSLLWLSNKAEQIEIARVYLSKTIAHYKRMQLQGGSEVQHIIDAYSAVAI